VQTKAAHPRDIELGGGDILLLRILLDCIHKLWLKAAETTTYIVLGKIIETLDGAHYKASAKWRVSYGSNVQLLRSGACALLNVAALHSDIPM